jgi:nucleoside-diphosphate-sugar epimerase
LTDDARARGFDALPRHAWRAVDADALRGLRIFLTGGTGFVGRWFLAGLPRVIAYGATPQVAALVRGDAAPVTAPWLSWVRGDVRSFALAGGADVIVHAALPSTAARADRDAELRETALRGAEAVIAHARRSGARRVLVLSSGAVYGPADAPLGEGDPFAASDDADTYGRVKREVEDMFRAASGPALDVVVARLFTCIGVGYRAHEHLAHVGLLRAARAGEPIALRSDGTAVRSYLFGADLAVWLLALVTGSGSDVVNVGSDESLTVLEFARLVARAGGRDESAVVVGAEPDARRHHFVPNITRARTVYGLEPWTSAAEAVALTLAAGE